MNVLIIEDEIKTARELKQLAETLRGDIRVLAILQSIKASVEWFNNNPPPDLILSDIQLADGLSFEIFKQAVIKAPVIFCTAFDEYAIHAFEANGIDYLLKPVDENRLLQSLEKYDTLKSLFSTEKTAYEKNLQQVAARLTSPWKNTLLIHFQEKIIPVKTTAISFIHYSNGIVAIYTGNQKYIYSSTMDELETMLSPESFFRANRQFIINRTNILNVEHYFSRRLLVKLSLPTPEHIIISKVRAPEFLHWMELA
jgi:two-component system, LytTR family, response regulator LytT